MLEFEQVTTRAGDRGDSCLYNGERRGKDEHIFDALGDIDELSSWLGLIKTGLRKRASGNTIADIEVIQKNLITAGGEIATPRASEQFHTISKLTPEDIEHIEKIEYSLLKKTRIEAEFILPGKTELSSQIDIGRSVCRRAERAVVRCIRRDGSIHLSGVQNYLNRLSDFLFILARAEEQQRL